MPFPVFARVAVLGALACGVWLKDSFVSDTWWALRAGQDIWHSHRVLLTETYSYTAHGTFWPNHEWLWQVAAYAVWHLGGAPTLAILNGLLAVLALALARPPGALRRADAYAPLLLGPLVLLAVTVRPQVASMLIFVIVLRLAGSDRWWPLPVIAVVWANLHGGVLLGVAVVGAGVVVAGARAVGRGEWRRVRIAVPVGLTCVAATLATPLGVRLWSTVRNSVGQSKRDGVSEWATAFRTDFPALYLWAAIAGCVLVVLVRRRRLDAWRAQFLLAATTLCAVESIVSLRNAPFFALAAIVLLIEVCRPVTDDGATSRIPPRAASVIAASGLALASLCAYVLPPLARHAWAPISTAASAAIGTCPGHVYTTYNHGGDLIWWTPAVPVFEDNREYPFSPQVLALGLLGSPGRSTDYRATFEHYNVRCAAFTPDDATVGPFLRAHGWQIAYRDSQWTLMTRPGTRLISTS